MPRKLALIIGIDEYVNYDADGQLDGCVNDALLMKNVLLNQFGFEASQIEELHNKAATRQAMLAAMQKLVDRTEKDDIVVFHFSGHGSQRTSANLEEGTGMDSTLLPSDNGGEPLPNLAIADYEINEWLGRLSAKTSYITLIFDCCHSGTMTRDISGTKTRSLPPDTRSLEDMGVKRRQMPAVDGAASAATGAGGLLKLSDSYVVMSGCRDNEEASEYGYQSDDQYIATGALTYFLTRALMQAQPGATYRDVFGQARQNLLKKITEQHPQIEGRLDREIFGIKDIVPLRFIEVTSVDERTVVLAGGMAHGLEKNSIWNVFPPTTKQTEGASPAGKVKITKLDMLSSEAEIIEGKGTIVAGARCVQNDPEDKPAQSSTQQMRASYSNALSLNNPNSKLNVDFTIYRVSGNSEDGDADLEDANSGDFQFNHGDYLAFKIVNNSPQQVFVSVLDFGLSGKISLMYPYRKSGELIEPGRTLLFGTGRSKIRLGLPKKTLFDQETFKAFISNEEADFRWLEQDGMRSADEWIPKLMSKFKAALNGVSGSEDEVTEAESIDEDWIAISRSFKLQK